MSDSLPNPSRKHTEAPPGAWVAAQRLRVTVMAPIERFLHVQTASGILLLVAAVVALTWANSPWADTYHQFWHSHVSITIPMLTFDRSLHFWVNDILMTIFFFVVGLEIKREIAEGELSELRRASLPIAAAIGGMVVPAGIYLAFNAGSDVQNGWGVPMATDIAFAVGVLTLLGGRVSAALRILLLALAIIDDIGAILVIAFFYTSQLNLDGLIWVALGGSFIFLFKRSGVRPAYNYLPWGALMWAGTYRLGVHPTIAGVMVGLVTPATSWFGREGFLHEARSALKEFNRRIDVHDEHDLLEPLDRIATARREAISPVVRLQTLLHPWVAYVIMPVFALANAGVTLKGLDFTSPTAFSVMMGVGLGLVVGKPLGIVLISWLAVKSGLSSLPKGVGYGGLFIVGATGGIGFTMAIFIGELAFAGSPSLQVAKLAVLIASATAAAVGLVAGNLILPKELPEDVASVTVAEAEKSTEF